MKQHHKVQKLVLRIGGRTLLDRNNNLDITAIERTVSFCHELLLSVDKLILIVGGAGAHQFIDIARHFHATDGECDELGLSSTMLASRTVHIVLRNRIPGTFPLIADTLALLDSAIETHRLIVVGPIQGSASSSDSVAALVAEHLAAEMLIVVKSKINYLERISVDKRSHSRLRDVRLKDVINLVESLPEKAGFRPILDFSSLRVFQRSCYRVIIVKTAHLKGLSQYISNLRDFSALEIVRPTQVERRDSIVKLEAVMDSLIEEAKQIYLSKSQEALSTHLAFIAETLQLIDIYSHAIPSVTLIAAWWCGVDRRFQRKSSISSKKPTLGQRLAKLGIEQSLVEHMLHVTWSCTNTSLPTKPLEAFILQQAYLASPYVIQSANSYELTPPTNYIHHLEAVS